MKKVLLIMFLAVMTVTNGYAQFEQGKKYVGASMSGLELSYSDMEDFRLGFQAQAGYFCMDNWMLSTHLAYGYDGSADAKHNVSVGAGTRYYFDDWGVFLGANVNFVHQFHNCNDVRPGVEFGYAFFLNGHVTIEPAVYYEHSFKNNTDFSKCGLRIGFGYYF